MRLLDLFCGAGGAAMGYQRAGFEVVGVDNRPQKNYPFEFHQADALEYCAEHGHEFDAIHASPPCQAYSRCTPTHHKKKHADLISITRGYLKNTSLPFVIENVEDARSKLEYPITLCGSMFGLPIRRHRCFEIRPMFFSLLPPCNHLKYSVLISGSAKINGKRFDYATDVRRQAIGCLWMGDKDLDNAIPPAYTEWIGHRLMETLNR